MKIFVTGCNGFIGTHLCARLRQEHEVFYLARPHSETDVPGACGNTFFFANNNIYALSRFLSENKIDGIIHLASLYIQAHKPEDIPDIIQSNVYLGTAVLEAASMAGTKWFLNTGTIWQNYNVPDFSDEYCPVNLYAASKQAFMTMAKYYTETSGIRFCTLKLCDTYGPNDTRRKIISLFDEIAASGKCLDMSPGEQIIDIVHVDEVVTNFVRLADMLDSDKTMRAEYVVTSGNPCTLRELAHRYELEHNVNLNINWGGREYRKREVMRPYIGNLL